MSPNAIEPTKSSLYGASTQFDRFLNELLGPYSNVSNKFATTSPKNENEFSSYFISGTDVLLEINRVLTSRFAHIQKLGFVSNRWNPQLIFSSFIGGDWEEIALLLDI